MKVGIVSQLVRGVWAMSPAHAESYYPMVLNILTGKATEKKADEDDRPIMEVFDAMGNNHGQQVDDEQKYVAVIPIKDVIVKYDMFCGPVGMQTISRWIREAAQNKSVAAIILDMDTPGGDGGACQLPTQEIVKAKMEKPVLAYTGDGMCASAGYYFASNCTEVYSTFKTDLIGSIGTYVTLLDWKSYYESEGMPVHEIYATKSTEKNKDLREAIEGKYENIRENFIDPFNEEFIQTVRAGRPDIDEQVFSGGLYYPEKALSLGLIDGVKTFDETIARAFELADDYNNNNTSNMSLLSKKKASFESLKNFASTNVEDRTAEMLEEVNAELQNAGIDGVIVDKEEHETMVSALESSKDALTTANSTVKGVIKALGKEDEKEVDVVQAVEELVQENADQAEKLSKSDKPENVNTGEEGSEIKDDKSTEVLDALEHNVRVDEDLEA